MKWVIDSLFFEADFAKILQSRFFLEGVAELFGLFSGVFSALLRARSYKPKKPLQQVLQSPIKKIVTAHKVEA